MPLKRWEWYASPLNEAQYDCLKRRPVEFFKLLVGEEAVSTFMEGHEYQRISGLLHRAYSHPDHDRNLRLQGLEELIRLPVHIHHDPFGAPEGIADRIKWCLGKTAGWIRKS